jgi:hypothetical protein
MAEIRPCPFCGGECLTDVGKYSSWVFCDVCSYECRDFEHEPDAIAAHNRVAGAVELVREMASDECKWSPERCRDVPGEHSECSMCRARAIMEES